MTQTISDNVLSLLESTLGPSNDSLTLLHGPDFQGNEWQYVKECIDTAWVSSAGKFVDRFEQMIADYTGAKHAIVVSNGTAALHVALHMAGVRPGDEVLAPALSFVATANAIAQCGAVPHFVDSSDVTLGLDPGPLVGYLDGLVKMENGEPINSQTGQRIGAIVPMHTYGHPIQIVQLMELADRYNIPVVEDSAESLGSLYDGKHTGTFGKLGIFSFNGNKTITTGGGGAIITDDDDLAEATRHITTTGKVPHKWEFVHDVVAWNYRLPNINAALGCAQLERLPEIIERKRALAARYRKSIRPIDGIAFVDEPANCRSNFWLNTIRIDGMSVKERDEVLDKVNAAGFQCRPTWRLLSTLPMYKDSPKMPLPVAEKLENSVINLPSSSYL